MAFPAKDYWIFSARKQSIFTSVTSSCSISALHPRSEPMLKQLKVKSCSQFYKLEKHYVKDLREHAVNDKKTAHLL